MSLNGISTLATKELKQAAKLNIAKEKRKGKIVAGDGTVSGGTDSSAIFYRALNTLHINDLPTKYNGDTLVDNGNGASLRVGRPWR